MNAKIFWFIRTLMYKPFMGGLGRYCYIGKPIYFNGIKRLFLGNKVRIYPSSRIEIMKDGLVSIKDDVSIGQSFHVVSAKEIIIGTKTTISANVFITDVEHEYENINVHIMNQSLKINATTIGDNCFIGYGVVIRAGTHLGKQCIVGANSVVKGAFPAYSVIAGNPAIVIKRYDLSDSVWKRTDTSGKFIEEKNE
jgi:acetyltransferase-like isoleucine patch superfamily enzyme